MEFYKRFQIGLLGCSCCPESFSGLPLSNMRIPLRFVPSPPLLQIDSTYREVKFSEKKLETGHTDHKTYGQSVGKGWELFQRGPCFNWNSQRQRLFQIKFAVNFDIALHTPLKKESDPSNIRLCILQRPANLFRISEIRQYQFLGASLPRKHTQRGSRGQTKTFISSNGISKSGIRCG